MKLATTGGAEGSAPQKAGLLAGLGLTGGIKFGEDVKTEFPKWILVVNAVVILGVVFFVAVLRKRGRRRR